MCESPTSSITGAQVRRDVRDSIFKVRAVDKSVVRPAHKLKLATVVKKCIKLYENGAICLYDQWSRYPLSMLL